MKRFSLAAPLLLLAGCASVGPDFHGPAPVGGSYAPSPAAPGAPVARLGEGPSAGASPWWSAFGSAQLDALVAKAMAGNRTLAASRATLAKANAHIRAVAGRQLPQVDATGQLAHEQVNLAAYGFDASSLGGNPEFDLYSVGAGVSYDLDLFGGARRATEQAVAEAAAQQHETEAAHLTIAGRVVIQVLTIAALNERIATERALLAEDTRNVDLTRARERAGAGTQLEVLSAQGQLAADQANLPMVEQQLAEARAMLAVLVGVSPGELEPTPLTLADLHLPGEVPVALPSELVHQRPDIVAAEQHLHAATAAIGVATARLYPDITLGASFQQAATHPEDVFGSNWRGFSLLAGLTAPIFHGGTLKAEKRGAEAEAQAAAARYQQTVLEAFGQVSGLLAALGNDQKAVAVREESGRVAERSLQLSRRSFQVGNSGILQVLDASRSAQQARIGLVEARSRQLLDVARLYVATAGGWISPAETAK